jgi:hypothetical protein
MGADLICPDRDRTSVRRPYQLRALTRLSAGTGWSARLLSLTALFARSLERRKALAKLFDHGNFFTKRPAGDFAASFGLAGEDVGNVRIRCRFSVAHGLKCNSQGSVIPALRQNAHHASLYAATAPPIA